MKTKELNNIFIERCKGFSDAHQALDFEITENKKLSVCAVTLNAVKIEFVYLLSYGSLISQSTLFCRIYLNKNDPMSFHLPELFDYSNINDFRQCYFPYIESKKRMDNCFSALEGIIDEYLPLINDIAAVESTRFYNAKLEMLRNEFKISAMLDESLKNSGDVVYSLYYATLALDFEELSILPDFTFPFKNGYFSFLNGDFEAAKAFYEKRIEKGKATGYDKRLYSFICENEKDLQYADDLVTSDISDIETYVTKNNFLKLAKPFILIYLCNSAVLLGLCFLLRFVVSIDTYALLGFNWIAYVTFVVALLPSVFGAIAFRRKLAVLFRKKDLQKYLDFDDIINSRSDLPGNIIFAVLCVIAVMLVSVFTVFGTVRVYDDHIKCDADANFVFESIYYRDVEKIYHIDARYNIYGGKITRGSYILEMNSGEILDLDMITTEKETENTLLALMHCDMKSIVFVDTERDLPPDIHEKLNELKE